MRMRAKGDVVELTLGHSPDADDAFMWWPLGDATPGRERAAAMDTGRFRFRIVAEDIETLNRRAEARGDLDVTAISMGAYPWVQGRYALTACGGSFGDGYGPKVVVRRRDAGNEVKWLRSRGVRAAIPGARTTAHLALRLCAGADVMVVEAPFERIVGMVVRGEVEAGVVIHEAQLTFGDAGLALLVDLGAWWKRETGLPLPLGGNAVRRDLDERFGAGTASALAGVLRRSIEHAMARREDGLAFAREFAGEEVDQVRMARFVAMYVNPLTLDAGAAGEEAVRRLVGWGAEAGLCPPLQGGFGLVRPAGGGGG